MIFLLMIIKVYFGDSNYSEYTIHKDESDEARKQRYINRHKKNENWTKSSIDTADWWALNFLWNKTTIKDSIMTLKKIQYIILI
jgi:hypothetical protein